MNTSEPCTCNALFRDYTQFRVRFEPEEGVLRVSMQGQPVPCYSEALLGEARAIQCAIESGGGLIEHEGSWVGQLEQKIGFGCVNRHLQGVLIQRLQAGNFVRLPGKHLTHANDVAQIGQYGVRTQCRACSSFH